VATPPVVCRGNTLRGKPPFCRSTGGLENQISPRRQRLHRWHSQIKTSPGQKEVKMDGLCVKLGCGIFWAVQTSGIGVQERNDSFAIIFPRTDSSRPRPPPAARHPLAPRPSLPPPAVHRSPSAATRRCQSACLPPLVRRPSPPSTANYLHACQKVLGTIGDKKYSLKCVFVRDVVYKMENVNTHYPLYLQRFNAHSRTTMKRIHLASNPTPSARIPSEDGMRPPRPHDRPGASARSPPRLATFFH
jgi:hypothetical protein